MEAIHVVYVDRLRLLAGKFPGLLCSPCLWWWGRLCRRWCAAGGCARAVLVWGGVSRGYTYDHQGMKHSRVGRDLAQGLTTTPASPDFGMLRTLKVPCAPKWFDSEFSMFKTTKLLAEARSGTWAKRIYPYRFISSCREGTFNKVTSIHLSIYLYGIYHM